VCLNILKNEGEISLPELSIEFSNIYGYIGAIFGGGSSKKTLLSFAGLSPQTVRQN